MCLYLITRDCYTKETKSKENNYKIKNRLLFDCSDCSFILLVSLEKLKSVVMLGFQKFSLSNRSINNLKRALNWIKSFEERNILWANSLLIQMSEMSLAELSWQWNTFLNFSKPHFFWNMKYLKYAKFANKLQLVVWFYF